MVKLTGGYTNYGESIGILMLDTIFPRIPGDIGNAHSYPFPVRYKTVKNAVSKRIMGASPDEALLTPFIEAAKELESEGVKAITTSCGFLSQFQPQLAAAVNVPVFTSALMLAPLIHAMIGRDKLIGIFTERAWNMNEAHFNGAGWSSKDIPVQVSGMPEGSIFPATFIEQRPEADRDALEECMRELTKRHMREYPDTGAILFECTNFGPFSKIVQDISGVPVFGINQMIEWVASCVNIRSYY